jgi:outer membrane protein assembly factor BamA
VWWIGRLVSSASWTARRNADNSEVVLGGDNGLRGHPSGAFSKLGGSVMRATVEARTLPLVIASVHVGGVAFYDAGSVYTRLGDAEFHHGAGIGLRVLFPQFNYDPFRLDFGVPLDGDGFTVLLSYSSRQAI